MIPEKRSPILEIPVTFDSTSKPQGLSNNKFYLTLLVFGLWIAVAIISLFVEATIVQKILFIIISFIVVLYSCRFLLLREHYFMKKRMDLVEKDYQYSHSMFWNIYEITNGYPAICRYANGLKSIFVVFDKDVIVGREPDAEYYHYEAIAEAYLQMSKRGIDCIHIDYMDTVGKDERVKCLFDTANQADNEDLRDVLLRIFDNVEYIMQHSYASYDVYCFFYRGKDELFMDELDVILDSFLEANYIRYRILDKNEIGELVKSVFNINDFSVRDASERLFLDLGGTHYLTPIWVERTTSNGVERVTLNKTSAQKEAEKATREAEKGTRKGRKRGSRQLMDEDLESFETVNNSDYNGGYNQGYGEMNYNNQNMQNNQNQNYNYNYQQGFDEVIEDMSFDEVMDDVQPMQKNTQINVTNKRNNLDGNMFGMTPKSNRSEYNEDDEDLEVL